MLNNDRCSAYLDVRSDKSDTNWLICDYEASERRSLFGPHSHCYQSDRSDKLQLTKTGTGGLTELRELLDDNKASFAYARISFANDKESKREKFILVVCHPSHTIVLDLNGTFT